MDGTTLFGIQMSVLPGGLAIHMIPGSVCVFMFNLRTWILSLLQLSTGHWLMEPCRTMSNVDATEGSSGHWASRAVGHLHRSWVSCSHVCPISRASKKIGPISGRSCKDLACQL